MIREGWIGEPTAVSFDVNIKTDWSAWNWLVNSPQLDFFFHSIHYFDAIRAMFGEPSRVFATTSRRPGQVARGETRTISTLVYGGELRAVVHVNHENIAGDVKADFRIDGTEGSIRGTIGMLENYPYGKPDTLQLFSQVLPTDNWLSYPVSRRWIPDAFTGTIASLLHAVATDTEAATNFEDNLRTVELICALYESAESGEAVLIPA
jgi:predicted dehydrogenase